MSIDCLPVCPNIDQCFQQTTGLSEVLSGEEGLLAWEQCGRKIGRLAVRCSGPKEVAFSVAIPLRFAVLRNKFGLPTDRTVEVQALVCGAKTSSDTERGTSGLDRLLNP